VPVYLDYFRLSRPVENGYIEIFNIRLCDECLSVELFFNMVNAYEATTQIRAPLSFKIRSELSCVRRVLLSYLPLQRSSSIDDTTLDTLISVFHDRVIEYGSQIAICTPEKSWSYRELDLYSDKIAHRLALLSLPRQGRVALYFRHGPLAIAAIIAALKVGMCYVPIEPSWPVARIKAILADSEPAILLYGPDLSIDEVLLDNHQSLLVTGDEWDNTTLPFINDLSPQSDDLAYILYTSGSTGQPKGVMQSHRNVLLHIDSYRTALEITSSDRLTFLSNYAFDAGVMDLYGALLTGATLLPFDPKNGGFSALSNWITKYGPTIYHSTPTLYRAFLSSVIPTKKFFTIHTAVLGGEEAFRSDWELFRNHFVPPARLINGYGPTECTLALQSVYTHQSTIRRDKLDIGYPVGSVQVWLEPMQEEPNTNDSHESYPVGQIILTCPQIALGYWKNPELTVQKFMIPSGDTGYRRYLTGDVGRLLSGGQIEFVARGDSRLKIRGHCVEPAEVEAQLLAIPEVVHAVVFNTGALDSELVAYLEIRSGSSIDGRSVRSRLSSLLPAEMIPSKVVLARELPRTATGKIDRLACQTLTEEELIVREEAETELHSIVLAAWAKVASHHDIHLEDDFYSIGGDSLSAVQVYLAITEKVPSSLSFAALFSQTTLAGMIDLLREDLLEAQPTVPHQIIPKNHSNTFRLSAAQERFWSRQLAVGQSMCGFNVSIVYVLPMALDVALIRKSLVSLQECHEILSTRLISNEEGVLCQLRPKDPIPLRNGSKKEMRRILSSDENRLSVLQEEASLSFNLFSDSLIRAVYHTPSKGRAILQLTFHHLIIDHWSRILIQNQLSDCLQGKVEKCGQFTTLSEWRYEDFVFEQKTLLYSAPQYQDQLAFWRELLSDGYFETIKIPYLIDPRSKTSFRGSHITRRVDRAISANIRGIARESQVTLFVLLLAVLQIVLFSMSGQIDLVITTDSANRNNKKWAKVVGLFTNVLILRSQIRPEIPFGQHLRELQVLVRKIIANQDVPFADICTQIVRCDLSQYHSRFPVCFFLETSEGDNSNFYEQVIEVSPHDISRDLIFTVILEKEHFDLSISYRGVLLEKESIVVMIKAYEATLHAVSISTNISIEDLAANATRFLTNAPGANEEQRDNHE
jgi:amino acid adenylation domain-containing protein